MGQEVWPALAAIAALLLLGFPELWRPVGAVFGFGLRWIAGGLVLTAVNGVGALVGLWIPVNPVTALATGLLGTPGFLLLVLLRYVVLPG